MPTTVLTMLSVGAFDQWTLVGGSTKFGNMNLDDGDTTRITEGTSGERQSFKLAGFDGVIPDTAIIEKIEHSMKIREEVGTHGWGIRPGWILGGIRNYGTTRNTTVSFTLYTEEIGRPSGGEWARSELANVEFLLEATGTADGHSQQCTYGYATVTWTAVDVIRSEVQTASAKVIQNVHDDNRYTLKVPLWIARKLELLDVLNVSHEKLLLSASRLASVDAGELSGLFDKWRRMVVDLVSVSTDYAEREAVFEFADLEQELGTYVCTEKLVGITADDNPGMLERDIGGQRSSSRAHRGYLIQEGNVIDASGRGSFVAYVNPSIAKRSYLGLLCEDVSDNIVPRSVFDSGLTGFTTVLNSGTVTAGTTRKFFVDGITTQSIAIARANNSADTYVQVASLSVNSADVYRRVAFIYSSRGPNQAASWWLQRASDSWYWNESGGAWQSGFVWNVPSDITFDGSFSRATYYQSSRIPAAVTTTWTIAFGLDSATTPVTGGTLDLGYIGCHKGSLRVSPIPTFGSTVTTEADTVKNVLDVDVSDPVRQLHWAGHGTIELSLLAEQDVTDLAVPSKHALLVVQYGSSGKDYDAVTYERTGADERRFTYERWRDIAGTSTLDNSVVALVDLVRGTTYHVTARNIGNDAELGSQPLTMLIRANSATQLAFGSAAAALHSTAEKHTELFVGCAPAATGMSRAPGYLSDVHCSPRVITNEEMRW